MKIGELLFTLGRSSFDAGVLILIVLAAQRVFRRYLSPRWNCALWLLVGLRLVPFSINSPTSIFNLLPHWPARISRVTVAPSAFHALPGEITPAAAPTPFTKHKDVRPVTGLGTWRWSWSVILFWTWLGGLAVLSGHVLYAWISFRRRIRESKPIDQPEALDTLRDCCKRLQITRVPFVEESREVTAPGLYGLFHPKILLPKGFASRFSPAELRFVFWHELAHVKRRDLLLNWLATVLQLVHWFNPFVWIGFARWRIDREIACDALALEAAGDEHNKEYGETILRLLDGFIYRPKAPGLLGILEDRCQLRRRIIMIAQFESESEWSAFGLVLAAAIAVGCLTDAQNLSEQSHSAVKLPVVTAIAALSPVVPKAASPAITNPIVLKGSFRPASRYPTPTIATVVSRRIEIPQAPQNRSSNSQLVKSTRSIENLGSHGGQIPIHDKNGSLLNDQGQQRPPEGAKVASTLTPEARIHGVEMTATSGKLAPASYSQAKGAKSAVAPIASALHSSNRGSIAFVPASKAATATRATSAVRVQSQRSTLSSSDAALLEIKLNDFKSRLNLTGEQLMKFEMMLIDGSKQLIAVRDDKTLSDGEKQTKILALQKLWRGKLKAILAYDFEQNTVQSKWLFLNLQRLGNI